MNRLINILESLWGVLGKLLTVLILWLAPIHNYIILVLVLVAIDNITGIYDSIKMKKQPFTPGKLRMTVEKFIFYGLAIITAFILQKIMGDGTEIAKLVAAYIGGTEAVSSYKHISNITGTNVLAELVKIINSKIKDYVGIKIVNKKVKQPTK